MDEEGAEDASGGTSADRRRAAWEALALGLFALGAVALGISGLWLTTTDTISDNYRRHLASIVAAVSVQVDGVELEGLQLDRARQGAAAGVVDPMQRIADTIPDVVAVYALAQRPGGPLEEVARASIGTGAAREAGTLSPAGGLGTPRVPLAFDGGGGGRGQPEATRAPYAHAGLQLMTAWAPVRSATGVQVGVVGIDVDARTYLARLSAARRAALTGLLPASIVVMVLAGLYHRVRRRGLTATATAAAAARAAERSSRVLAQEQQRLRNIIDGTNVSTWEAHVPTGEIRIDPRYAAMMGRTLDELVPMTSESWYRLLHPEDRAPARAAIEDCFARRGSVFEIDFRMAHKLGHWVWVRTRGTVIEWDADQKPVRMVGTHIDVSATKEFELALRESESKLRSLFELSPVGIALSDRLTGRFLQVNEALVGPTGYTRDELLSMTCWDITTTPDADLSTGTRSLQDIGDHGRYGPIEREYRRRDGTTYPVMLSGIQMKDAEGRDVVWSIVQDISQRKAMESELSAAALRDKLTGLANRTLFMERLQASVRRVKASRQKYFAVLFLDFDRFKLVNDAMGHEAGDQLLNEIATRLRNALRTADDRDDDLGNLIARFGGDEFLVLVNDLRDPRDAERIARRLLASLAPAYTINGREVHSTASIGIVTSVQCVESAEAVVRNADVAMYEAKRAGRGCSVLFSEAMHTRLARHLTIEGGLRKALGTDQLRLVYQPIVELESGRMVSVEALVRWEHPTLGAISPTEFIPVAEESGLIVPLGQWVMLESCRMLATWRARDPDGAPQYVSINVSRAELALGDRLLHRLQQCLAQTGIGAEAVQLEVTEREVMRDPETTLALMRRLRELGVRMAMDDFGTGTSSLACLRQYPFDVIKIDRSFVNGLTADPDVLAVIHATITLVENLGKASVAEGIEEPAQVAILQSLGCRFGQGYFFSRPVPAEVLIAAPVAHRVAV